MNNLDDFKQAFEEGLSPEHIRHNSLAKAHSEVLALAVKVLEEGDGLADTDVVSLLLSLIHNLLIEKLKSLPALKRTQAMIGFQFMLPELMARVTQELNKGK